MTNNDKKTDERREFYRVSSKAAIEMTLLNQGDLLQGEEFILPPEYQMLNEFRSMNSDSSAILRKIQDDDKNIGNYLKHLNKKLDLLASTIASNLSPINEQTIQQIDISEGGMKFLGEDVIGTDSSIALKLTLLPDNLIFSFKGIVKTCDKKKSSRGNFTGHLIHVEFIDVDPSDQHLLSKYVFQQQRRQLKHTK